MINIYPTKYEDFLKHDSRVWKFHHVQQSIICTGITNFRQREVSSLRSKQAAKRNIPDEININREELQRVVGNFIKTCQICIDNEGGQFQHLRQQKLVSTTISKIVTEMWLVVSPRSYAVRSPPRVRQQYTVKSPLLQSTLIVISLYILY